MKENDCQKITVISCEIRIFYSRSPHLSNEAHDHLSEGVPVLYHSFDQHVFLPLQLDLHCDLDHLLAPCYISLCSCNWITINFLHIHSKMCTQSSVMSWQNWTITSNYKGLHLYSAVLSIL